MSTSSAPLEIGRVALAVSDPGLVGGFYEKALGLQPISMAGEVSTYGAGGKVLLELRADRAARHWTKAEAGLFHTAFLLPSRADLGRWLRRAIDVGIAFDGAADHHVSEALYLTDPEGNGIEIYADRPRESWQWSGDQVQLTTEPLDVQGLIAAGGSAAPDAARVPDLTVIGHIHLRVGGIPQAEVFYRDVLGLEVTARRPGATFYATGGYHHHVATNSWLSRNAPKRSGTTTGLASFELEATDDSSFNALAERLLAAGGRQAGDAIKVADPWLNRIVVRKA